MTTINRNSLQLLQKMVDIQYQQFVVNKPGNMGTLSKLSRIQDCFNQIKTIIETRPNSTFLIKDEEETMAVVITNVKERNDHVRRYSITISKSSETFMMEEVIQYEEPIHKTLIKFEESKL